MIERDPLYRSRTALPGAGETLDLAGVSVELTTTDTAPDVVDAQWMNDREITLTVTDDLGPASFADVLPAFVVAATDRADRPTTAALALPSRDVERAAVARGAGFLPASVLAVADLRRPVAAATPADDPAVRDAVPGDAPAVGELWCEQADYEARVGTLRTSDAIRTAIRAEAVARIDGASTVLVAEVDGRVVGAVVAETPDDSAWAGARLTVAPASYLSMASTSATSRSHGLGTRLVAELHRRNRAAGVAASVLHYSAYNPLSVPFWSQRGYRPVVTLFARRVR